MSRITYNKLNEIIEKEYTIKELSYWERVFNQTLSGNVGNLLVDGVLGMINKGGEWIQKYNEDDNDWENENNIYNYEESVEERINRLYKEMNRT